jgi:hypothetical protein
LVWEIYLKKLACPVLPAVIFDHSHNIYNSNPDI